MTKIVETQIEKRINSFVAAVNMYRESETVLKNSSETMQKEALWFRNNGVDLGNVSRKADVIKSIADQLVHGFIALGITRKAARDYVSSLRKFVTNKSGKLKTFALNAQYMDVINGVTPKTPKGETKGKTKGKTSSKTKVIKPLATIKKGNINPLLDKLANAAKDLQILLSNNEDALNKHDPKILEYISYLATMQG